MDPDMRPMTSHISAGARRDAPFSSGRLQTLSSRNPTSNLESALRSTMGLAHPMSLVQSHFATLSLHYWLDSITATVSWQRGSTPSCGSIMAMALYHNVPFLIRDGCSAWLNWPGTHPTPSFDRLRLSLSCAWLNIYIHIPPQLIGILSFPLP